MTKPTLLIEEAASAVSTLRNQITTRIGFRQATRQLSHIVAAHVLAKLPGATLPIRTPVGEATGTMISGDVLLAPILRSGMVMLDAFISAIPDAPVAFVGLKRDERTLKPMEYCWSCPEEATDEVILLDPMLATANSAVRAVELFTDAGYKSKQIYFAGFFASREGANLLSDFIPPENITVAVVDPWLTEKGFINPGCGDLGDRFYGTPRKLPTK